VDVRPQRIGGPRPSYPEELKREGVGGQATVEVIIDPSGYPEPGSIRVLTATRREFGEAAATVVAASCYSPGLRHGLPVRVRLRIPMRFWTTRS